MIKPSMRFEDFIPPSKPNYKNLDSWAAHPLHENGPDQLTPNNEFINNSKENAFEFQI